MLFSVFAELAVLTVFVTVDYDIFEGMRIDGRM